MGEYSGSASLYRSCIRKSIKRVLLFSGLASFMPGITGADYTSHHKGNHYNHYQISPKQQLTIASGDYSTRIPDKARFELKQLANAFNEMASRIEQSHLDLERKVEERSKSLETLIDENPTGILLFNAETYLIEKANRMACDILGYNKDVLIGKTL